MTDRKRTEAKEKPKKHLTRNQYEQKKQKERLKKERQRASQTEEKKQAILPRRRELYAENKVVRVKNTVMKNKADQMHVAKVSLILPLRLH